MSRSSSRRPRSGHCRPHALADATPATPILLRASERSEKTDAISTSVSLSVREGRRGEEEGEGEIGDNEVSLGEGGGGRKRGEGEIGDNQSTGTDV